MGFVLFIMICIDLNVDVLVDFFEREQQRILLHLVSQSVRYSDNDHLVLLYPLFK